MSTSLIPPEQIPMGVKADVQDLRYIKYVYGRLIDEMPHTALGLSAVQINIPINICVVDISHSYGLPFNPHQVLCLVNCEYKGISKSGSISRESCLSLPGETYDVPRHDTIWVKGYAYDQPTNTVRKIEKYLDTPVVRISGRLGDVLQHELDHSLQILIRDIGIKVET